MVPARSALDSGAKQEMLKLLLLRIYIRGGASRSCSALV